MKKQLTPAEKSKEWRKNNPRKVKAYAKRYCETHREENNERSRIIRSKIYFDGKCDEIFERDNWQCQECGVSTEQSILLFNRRLMIHHIDGNGESAEETNNDSDNLITLCARCHCRHHLKQREKKRWGNLLDQDNSKWKFPKLRELIQKEIKKGVGIQEAKRIVSKNTGIGFSMIDHRYYMIKEDSPKP